MCNAASLIIQGNTVYAEGAINSHRDIIKGWGIGGDIGTIYAELSCRNVCEPYLWTGTEDILRLSDPEQPQKLSALLSPLMRQIVQAYDRWQASTDLPVTHWGNARCDRQLDHYIRTTRARLHKVLTAAGYDFKYLP